MTDQPTKKRRRWFQFSLRALLVLTLIAALPMGWLAWRLDRVRQQREAVQWIESAGGNAAYEEYQQNDESLNFAQRLAKISDPAVELPGPHWLRKILGNDFFANVTDVRLRGGTDAAVNNPLAWQEALERLPALPYLESLRLDESTISDSQLATLVKLPRLKKLTLADTPITDAGIEQLGKLQTLEFLNLRDTEVTDGGIARLQTLLPHTHITWDGDPTVGHCFLPD